MSDDKALEVAKEAAKAVLDATCSPVTASLRVIGIALGKPDLDEVAREALQEDVVRLYQMIHAQVGRLDAEMKAKIDAGELGEIVTQSFVNMGRTASAEKRRLMRNVVVNGIAPGVADSAEKRYFVQLVADLDLAQVELLANATQREFRDVEPADDALWRALVQQLAARGLVFGMNAMPGFGSAIVDKNVYALTALGLRFVAFLRDPD